MTTLKTLEDKLESLRATRDFVNNQIADLMKEMKQLIPQPRNMKTVLFPIVRDFNCSIGPHVKETDGIFGSERTSTFEKADIYDLLFTSGCFESKSQARKNWTGIKEIPTGYTEIGPIGKQKLMLFIWNPSE